MQIAKPLACWIALAFISRRVQINCDQADCLILGVGAPAFWREDLHDKICRLQVIVTEPPGEVLFLGASGSQRGEDDWEITFRFAASPNVTGLTVGPITGIAKRGWEYLWVRYSDAEDQHVLVKQPIAAYVEKVYDEGNFAGLGIGS